MTDNRLSRRAILVTIGTTGTSTAVTTVSATAQDRDPNEYDRPRTIKENNVEITLWDCSRAVVDGPPEIAQILVHVLYTGTSQPEGITDTVSGTINAFNFDLPVDIRVNDHLHEFNPVDGSVIIESVNIYNSYNSFGNRNPLAADQGRIASVGWPLGEWECHEVMGMIPPDSIIRDPASIPYKYEVHPY